MNRGSNKLEEKWRLIEGELIEVEQRLQQIIETAGPEIAEVSSYIFNGSGKRMRPTLFLLASYHPQSRLFPYVDAAAGLELMHTASLLHDDVIDQASTRRGKDTVHIKWNNKISVLNGDYLLSQAFKMLVSYRNWRLMDIIVDIVQNMTEGEIEQAFTTTGVSDLEERYFKWIGKKSAYFFAGCCQAGSLLGGGDSEEQKNWSELGYNLGMAFQLIDDLLDYTGKRELTGKPVYGDLNNRVITLPLIRTINLSRRDDSIHRLLDHNQASDNQLSEVLQAVLDSDGPEYTYRKAQEYINKAEDVIKSFHGINEDVKTALKELIRDVLNRNK